MTLEAIDAGVSFGRLRAVDGVSLKARPGSLLALCGPNGAGKSTLLALLAGDLAPQYGRVCLDRVDLARWPAARLARRRAVLEQTPTLAAPFSVRELVALAIDRAVPPARCEAIIARVLEDVGLADRAHDRADQLSGGQRHRAHLARALAQLHACEEGGASFLLLDEPTASLDLAHQIAIMHVARRVAREGAAVIVVLHDLELAAAFADSVALLHRGRLVAQGEPAAVLEPERLSAVYETPIDVVRDAGGRLRVFPVYDIGA